MPSSSIKNWAIKRSPASTDSHSGRIRCGRIFGWRNIFNLLNLREENSEINRIALLMIQQLRWGEIRQERTSAPDTMFTTTGRRLYVIGDIDGGFHPRSNPYD